MHISKLHIRNFRCIENLELSFDSGLNVIIGENNTGKTAVLDALRIILARGDERRDIWISEDDFHVDSTGKHASSIEIDVVFSKPSVEQQAAFIELLAVPDSGVPKLQLHVRYEWDDKKERVKFPTLWGGENEGQAVPGEVLQLIYHVHLDALRDAARFIAPGRGSRIGELVRKLEPDEATREVMEKEVLTALRDLDKWANLRNNAQKIINKHLKQVTIDGSIQEVEVDFVESKFRRIAESLRLHLPRKAKTSGEVENQEVDSPTLFKIWQNGLGYNNLIYAATIFGDLIKRAESDEAIHLSLLIEEPEAHLHPQLQRLFFRYLEAFGKERIQVFVTSHSPTICSQADFDRINVLTIDDDLPTNIALASMPLDEECKRKLQRFLDVTKSQLFFAKGAIFVEGISEALLLPLFARRMGNEFDLDKHGIEVVNVNGTMFEPFAALFNSDSPDQRLGIPGAILTDDDRDKASEDEEMTIRAENAKSLEGGLLMVRLAEQTFEYELFKENEELLKKDYKRIHPKAKDVEGNTVAERAEAFVKKVKKQKALLAQELTFILESKEELAALVVPKYIKQAIIWIVQEHE